MDDVEVERCPRCRRPLTEHGRAWTAQKRTIYICPTARAVEPAAEEQP